MPFTITTTGSPTPTSVSAQVATTMVLDFENTSNIPFTLTVVVSDGTNNDTEVVAVTVVDVNDNSPVFSQPGGYTFTNNENELGTFVGTSLSFYRIRALRSRSLRDGSRSHKGSYATFVCSCSALRALNNNHLNGLASLL